MIRGIHLCGILFNCWSSSISPFSGDRNPDIFLWQQGTVHTAYYAWAMQQIDPERVWGSRNLPNLAVMRNAANRCPISHTSFPHAPILCFLVDYRKNDKVPYVSLAKGTLFYDFESVRPVNRFPVAPLVGGRDDFDSQNHSPCKRCMFKTPFL